jgi:oxygen-independent coproporphyrinogen-3 oxidase
VLGSPRLGLDLRLPPPGACTGSALNEWATLIEREIDLYRLHLPPSATIDEMRISWSSAFSATHACASPDARDSAASSDMSPPSAASATESITASADARHRSSPSGAVPDIAPLLPLVARLLNHLKTRLDIATDVSMSLAIPPALLTADPDPAWLSTFATWGFSRVEMGTPLPCACTMDAADASDASAAWVSAARRAGFLCVGAPFIYGGERQTPASTTAALRTLIRAQPGHIWLHSAADARRQFRPVLHRDPSERASAESTRILLASAAALSEAGYDCIGQDLYALADDTLAVAQRQGRLFKRPHGVSIRAVPAVLALGPGAIGTTGTHYHQNHAALAAYRTALEHGAFPVMRGMFLSADDLVRRAIIHALTADLFVDIGAIETLHRLDFRATFTTELDELAVLEQAGLLLFDDTLIELTALGRLLAGTVAMVFDRPLRESRARMPFQMRL